ncbi:MAG: hypothetical protein EZS28_056517, partial [Streblomastix strix]
KIRARPQCLGVEEEAGTYIFEKLKADLSIYPATLSEKEGETDPIHLQTSTKPRLKLRTEDVGYFIRCTYIPENILGEKGEPFT